MARGPGKTSASPSDDKKEWSGILKSLDTKTKVFGLIILVVEALFGVAIAFLPREQIIWAMVICAAVLLVGILGIVGPDFYEARGRRSPVAEVFPGKGTPAVDVLGGVIKLDEIVNGFIQTICRAFSLPNDPETTHFRIFIFQKIGNELVCTHFWAPNPVSEKVNKLRFQINSDLANKVAVVKAVMDDRVCKTRISPLPPQTAGVSGDPEPQLKYVLAAPIDTKDGKVWGTIDVDTADEAGIKVLESQRTEAALFRFAQHLGLLFSLPGVSRA